MITTKAINWRMISKKQILSEDFMREHKNNLDWYRISKKQILSEPFIEEMVEYVE